MRIERNIKMRNIINTGFGILLVVLASATVQAELQFVDNFDAMAGGNMPYNVATAGGGGIWSTNTGNTSGNIYVETQSGSTVIRFMTTSDGTGSRGFGVAAIDNTIEDTESGLAFFRFAIRSEGNAADTYLGIHALTGDTPFSVAGNDPEDYIVAGFHLVNGTGTAVNVVRTRDISSVLLAGLTRGQFYNCWIDADNAANTFDLYISAATGPAGAATLPAPTDLVADDLPFDNTAAYGSAPLMGAFFATPRMSSTTRSTNQSARTFIDEVWWDGDAGLVFTSKGARNPVPASGTDQVALDQVLSWEAPDDPNVEAVLGYNVYFSTNEEYVQNRDPSAEASMGQMGLSYDPDLAYDTQYFWRVVTDIRLNDPNHTVTADLGKVWNFTTLSSFPSITQQPSDVIVEREQTAQFTVAADSIRPASYQWYKSADRANDTPADDTVVSGGTSATLTLSNVSTADEGFYFCSVSNPSITNSNAAALAVKREIAHWTLDGLVSGQYEDSSGEGHHADPNGIVVFPPEGGVDPAITGNAAVIDAGNGWANAGTWNPSEFTGQLTLSLWVKWDGQWQVPNYQGLLGKRNAYTDDGMMWQLEIGNASPYNLTFKRHTTGAQTVATTGPLPMGQWEQVVVTYDGTTAVVYRNGESAVSAVMPFSDGKTATLMIGAVGLDLTTGAPISPMNGQLDDVRIFNTAYDATAVAAELYNPVSHEQACVNRSDPILVQYDIDDNCIVDMGDLAMLAAHWMDCFVVPDCI